MFFLLRCNSRNHFSLSRSYSKGSTTTISSHVPIEQVFSTSFTKLLGITHPIVSAPMLRTSGGLLAGHVARAGGVGFIGVGSENSLGPDWVSEQHSIAMDVLKEKNNKINGSLGFGFQGCFMKDKNNDKSFLKSLQLKPDVIWIAFVDSLKIYLSDVHNAGAKLFAMAFTVAEAQKYVQEGVDVIVLQGNDAGGHGMQYQSASIISLIPEVDDLLKGTIPILAAGGIADGRGMAAALTLGASGVVMGTRFYASSEALVSEKIHKNLISAKDSGNSTIVSGVFDCFSPLPWNACYTARGIRDYGIVKKYHHLCVSGKSHYKPTKEELEEFRKKQSSDPVTWSGTGVGLINSIECAGDIINSTIQDAKKCLKKPNHISIKD